MSVRVEERIIHLDGVCGVEEAETLAALLDQDGDWTVDLSRCRRMHAALAQVLLAFRPKVRGAAPEDVFFRDFLFPALALALEDG